MNCETKRLSALLKEVNAQSKNNTVAFPGSRIFTTYFWGGKPEEELLQLIELIIVRVGTLETVGESINAFRGFAETFKAAGQRVNRCVKLSLYLMKLF